jgi:hypothetical protein
MQKEKSKDTRVLYSMDMSGVGRGECMNNALNKVRELAEMEDGKLISNGDMRIKGCKPVLFK